MLHISTKKYKVIASIFLSIILLFSGFSYYLTHKDGTKTTRVGATMKNNEESLVFKNANYYEKSALLEVEMFYQGSLDNGLQKLEIKVFNAATGKEIPGKLEPINLNYYVVFIPNVDDLKQILVQFKTESSSNREGKDLGVVSLTPDNTTQKGSFKKQKTEYYEERFVTNLSAEAKQSIQNYETSISGLKKHIVQYEEANAQLESKVSFETEEEQKETQTKIEQNISRIEGLKGQILEVKKAQKALKDKIAMLEEKQ